MKIKFNEIEEYVDDEPGIYTIYTNQEIALKVGIGKNIKSRLRDHRASRQSGLKLKPNGSFDNPSDVLSKKSILAKHLYFDEAITNKHNLKDQEGRRDFLIENCFIEFEHTPTKAEARTREIEREASRAFRYQGRVIIRLPEQT